jgi:hypothetical protein
VQEKSLRTSQQETELAKPWNLSGPDHIAKEVLNNGCQEESCKEASCQEEDRQEEEVVTTTSLIVF